MLAIDNSAPTTMAEFFNTLNRKFTHISLLDMNYTSMRVHFPGWNKTFRIDKDGFALEVIGDWMKVTSSSSWIQAITHGMVRDGDGRMTVVGTTQP